MRRSRINRPATSGHDIMRIVEYGTATGTTWSPTRLHKPNDTIAMLGSLSSLLSTYPHDEASIGLGTNLGMYLATAQRTAHSASVPHALNASLNTIGVMLMGSTQTFDEFRAAWAAIGASIYEAMQTLPENVATQYWRMVRAIVDQTTIAQMPGYMFGQPFQVPIPPQVGGNLPGGGGYPASPSPQPRPSSPASGAASFSDRIAREAVNWAPEIGSVLGTLAGSTLGTFVFPGVGTVEGGALLGAAGAKIGDIIQERYGSAYTGIEQLSPQQRDDIAREALQRSAQQFQNPGLTNPGRPTPNRQGNLPGVPSFPEPGQTAPGSSRPQSAPMGGPLQNLVPASFGGGQDGLGNNIGGGVGGLVDGIVGAFTGGAAPRGLFTDLGSLTGQAVQGGAQAIDREV